MPVETQPSDLDGKDKAQDELPVKTQPSDLDEEDDDLPGSEELLEDEMEKAQQELRYEKINEAALAAAELRNAKLLI